LDYWEVGQVRLNLQKVEQVNQLVAQVVQVPLVEMA
jgi:hypothetical protein